MWYMRLAKGYANMISFHFRLNMWGRRYYPYLTGEDNADLERPDNLSTDV